MGHRRHTRRPRRGQTEPAQPDVFDPSEYVQGFWGEAVDRGARKAGYVEGEFGRGVGGCEGGKGEDAAGEGEGGEGGGGKG